MLNSVINELKIFIKNNVIKLFILLAVCLLGLILGIFLSGNNEATSIFSINVNNYYLLVLDNKFSVIKFLFIRIFNLTIILVLLFLLSLNKITIYFIPILVFYRVYILGVAMRFFIIKLGINGLMLFVFSVSIQNIFLTIAIIIFFIKILEIYSKCNKNILEKSIRILIIIGIIALIGIVIEFITLNFIFIPMNLYF